MKTPLIFLILIGVVGVTCYFTIAGGGRTVVMEQKPVEQTTTVSTAEMPLAKTKVFLETNKTSAAQLKVLIKNLKSALASQDEREKSEVLQSFRHWLPEDANNLDLLIENLQWETDQQTIVALGKMVLETGSTTSRKAMVDAALNFLLSDDLVDRRQASLQILASTSDLNSDLVQAVSRVSREDEVSEIRVGAVEAMTAWMKKHPGWKEQISNEISNTLKHSDDPEVRDHALAALSQH